MMQLKIVTSASHQANNQKPTDAEDGPLLHGTQILKELVSPWAHTDRIVCADSYYASVGAAIELQKTGL